MCDAISLVEIGRKGIPDVIIHCFLPDKEAGRLPKAH